MGAEHGETILAQHPDDRGEQPVIAGKGRAADFRQQFCAFGIRPQRQQRRPFDRPDHHDLGAAMLAQGLADRAERAKAEKLMRKTGDGAGIGKAIDRGDENIAAAGACRAGHLPRQIAAPGDDAKRAFHGSV